LFQASPTSFFRTTPLAGTGRADHGCEVRDARKRRVDGELERHGRQQEDERQVESILRLLDVYRVRGERHAPDEELRARTSTVDRNKMLRTHRVKLRHKIYGQDTIAILWV